MKNATLLIVLGVAAKTSDLEVLANAARERNLHLRILILGAMPQLPSYVYGMTAYGAYGVPDDWQANVDALNSGLERTRSQIAEYMADQGVSVDLRVVSGAMVDLCDEVVQQALCCDLILFGNDLRPDEVLFHEILHVALFKAPAGVVLNGLKNNAVFQPASAIVAWKNGLAASRAVRSALPILRATKDVRIIVFDPRASDGADGDAAGSEVAAWLSHQGCAVTIDQCPSGGVEVGVALMKRAKENGAALIVMGAYGHSRLREAIFGGTTRTMLEQTDHAILLCH
ncbi:universal stress protein [Pseudorhodobacter sp. W20_MBD10_FR17]|uniref:universal stress protein n=1 Tax=Pseudorhodobacter sp. W20_MBD10_FR17 TaxID=3240266 RepID=UPI003F99896D